jgi:hypothetical protein
MCACRLSRIARRLSQLLVLSSSLKSGVSHSKFKIQPSKLITMEALNRKPNLAVKKSMKLDDGATIEVTGVTARKMMELQNNKRLTDAERGLHLTAEKILVNGKKIVYDDLLDGFTDAEVNEIVRFANDLPEGEGEIKNG